MGCVRLGMAGAEEALTLTVMLWWPSPETMPFARRSACGPTCGAGTATESRIEAAFACPCMREGGYVAELL